MDVGYTQFDVWNLGQGTGASSSSTPKQITFSSATDNITKVASVTITVSLSILMVTYGFGERIANVQLWPSSITDEPQKVVDGKNIIGLVELRILCTHGEATGKM